MMPAARRLLALFAHPDDEAYAAGGTLALCAQRGVRVTVVSATRGEQGIARRAPRGVALANLRSSELAQSCVELGARPPLFLDLPDGALAQLDTSAVAQRLARLLREERPEVLITLGHDGGYGHLDHLACTGWLEAAVELLGSERPRRLLHVAFPSGLMRPLWSALRRKTGRQVVADLPAEAFGVDAAAADLRVPLTPRAQQRKLAAIGAHRSQLPGDDPRAFLWPGLVDSLLDEEWFTLAQGAALPPGADDPFAGL